MTRREYVVRKRRDGETQKRTSRPSFDLVDLEECMEKGASAARRGHALYTNPYVATRARAWTFAWERAHREMKGRKHHDSFHNWMKAWKVRQKGADMAGPPDWETAKKQLEADKQCGGKGLYRTKEDAVTSIRTLRASPSRDSLAEKLGAYQCDVCNGWHAGHGTTNENGRVYTKTIHLRTED